MKSDLYTKVVMTIIAACLVALAWSNSQRARAAERTTCHGDMKATGSTSPLQASIGSSYKIDVVCE